MDWRGAVISFIAPLLFVIFTACDLYRRGAEARRTAFRDEGRGMGDENGNETKFPLLISLRLLISAVQFLQ